MRERKLKVNLEGLWDNPHGSFIIRYKNIKKDQKILLAKRIKQTAKQITLRRETGPSIETIIEVLEEINPIILSEYTGEWGLALRSPFSRQHATTLTGYAYDQLCKAIYIITVRTKKPTLEEIIAIALLTNRNYEKVTNLIYPIMADTRTEQPELDTSEIGLEEVIAAERGIRRQEHTGAFTPDENYDRITIPTAEQETDNTIASFFENLDENEDEDTDEYEDDDEYETEDDEEEEERRTQETNEIISRYERIIPNNAFEIRNIFGPPGA